MTQTHHDDARGEALDWLSGRLRWERILRELHDRAEGAEPLTPVVTLPSARADDRAA